MACNLPGNASTPDKYWENIITRRDCVGPIPSNRWDPAIFDTIGLSEATEFAKVGGFIDDIGKFDAALFQITPKEARQIDPQQRILLELAWQCTENAGVSEPLLSDKKTSVHVGVINHDYERLLLADKQSISAHTGLGRSTSIAANRISYHFDLTGPSMAIDTACSSSLVALNAACQALHSRQADFAFAGGSNAILLPDSYIEFSRASMLSKSGKCHVFDRRADGFVRAEGGGMVLLKRLDDALIDGDHIHAVIASTSVNQDGKTTGLMSPRIEAQMAMMRDALNQSGLTENEIGYIEAHGTGTQAGDAAEIASLGEVYGQGARTRPCYVGSVKSNIGHTESAAGIAGLIKAILAVSRGIIPPNIHFETPNPDIDFKQLRIPVAAKPWRGPCGRPRVAAVNSFGFGGTNAHAIVRQAPVDLPVRTASAAGHLLLPLSTPVQADLERFRQQIQNNLNPDNGRNVAYTIGRQTRHKFRAGVIVRRDPADATRLLFDTAKAAIALPARKDRRLAFVFNGMGAEFGEGAIALYRSYQRFARVADLCDSIAQREHGINAIDRYFQSGQLPQIENLAACHMLHLTLQVAACELWKDWGIVPQAVVGHSLGEISAAVSSGAISLPHGIKAVIARANALAQFVGAQSMLAVAATRKQARQMITAHSDALFIAAENSPDDITLSGTPTAIRKIAEELQAQGKFYRPLNIPVPFHSPLIDGGRAQFQQSCPALAHRHSKIPWLSSVTGKTIDARQIDESFWWDNFRNPVRFKAALEAALDAGINCIVEIGAHPILAYAINNCLKRKQSSIACLHTLQRGQAGADTLYANAAQLFNMGFELNWTKVNPPGKVTADLQRTRHRQFYWQQTRLDAIGQVQTAAGRNPAGLLDTRNQKAESHWPLSAAANTATWLRRHRVHDEVIFPAAGYLEAALEAGHILTGQSQLELFKVEFERMFHLPRHHSDNPLSRCQLTTKQIDTGHQFQFVDTDATQTTVFCSGQLRWVASSAPALPDFLDCDPAPEIEDSALGQIEKGLQQLQFQGDHDAWSIDQVRRTGQSEIIARLSNTQADTSPNRRYLIDPALLDLCLRLPFAALGTALIYIPRSLDSLRLYEAGSDQVWCRVQTIFLASGEAEINLQLLDAERRWIAIANRLRLTPANKSQCPRLERLPQLAVPRWARIDPIASHAQWFMAKSQRVRQTIQADFQNRAAYYQRNQYYADKNCELTRIALAFIGDCFARHGFSQRGDRLLLADLAAQLSVAARQQPLFFSLVDLLYRHQLIKITGSGSTPLMERRLTVRCDLPRAGQQATFEFLQNSESSQQLSELLMLERCGKLLPAVLAGERNGLDALFPNGDMAVLAQFYRTSPVCRIYNEALGRCVRELLRCWPLRRKCRILEIGGGTGALLLNLYPALSSQRIEYTFTDVASSFVRAREKACRNPEWLAFAQYDFNSDPLIQGFSANYFDIVLASDCLHLARDLAFTLSSLQAMMHPGGHLLLSELTAEPDWARLVFGMSADWWHNAQDSRLHNSPVHTVAAWRRSLESARFRVLEVLSDRNDGKPPRHSIFIAETQKAPAPRQLPNQAADQRTLILSDNSDFSNALATALSPASVEHVVGRRSCRTGDFRRIRPDCAQDYVVLVETLMVRNRLPEHIIMLWNFGAEPASSESFEQLAAQTPFAQKLAHLIQAYDQLACPLPLLTLVSSRVHPLTPDASIELSACFDASIWAIGRTVRNEYPHSKCRIIDVDPKQTGCVGQLIAVLAQPPHELELSIRESGHFAPVIEPDSAVENLSRSDQNLVLASARPGDLGSLMLSSQLMPPCAEDEVVIAVMAASLNFRDVMIALDALPNEAVAQGHAQRSAGIECAGIVAKTGAKVTACRAGEHVAALSKNAISKFVSVNEAFVFPFSSHLFHAEQISAIPTALVTALQSFDCLENLENLESILIHTASGGVGVMLVHLARAQGLKVFATAGSAGKIAFLNSLGVSQASDSRSDKFVAEVLSWTGNAGVDVVVNTLGDELAAANLKILKPRGHFIELGKYASSKQVHRLITASKLALNLHVVDIDRMWHDQPARLAQIFKDAMQLAVSGKIVLPPYQTFPVQCAVEAFRLMAAAGHIGKVVLALRDLHHAQCTRRTDSITISPDATYVISGGSRGFGLATARWLCDLGAAHLIVIGRNLSKSGQLSQLRRQFNSAEVTLEAVPCDITDLAALRESIRHVLDKMPPVRGIFHCAMQIDDRALINLDMDSYATATDTKIQGAWNLCQAIPTQELDMFVLFSSVTSLLGPAGQGAYSAANAFIDSFARYLRKMDINALAINWGAVSDCGHVADSADAVQRKYGDTAVAADKMLQTLQQALHTQCEPQYVIAAGNWQQWMPHDNFSGPLAAGYAIGEPPQTADDRMTETGENAARALKCIADVAGVARQEIDLRESLADLGIDSLQAVELSHQLRLESGIQISAAALLESSSIQEIVKRAPPMRHP